MKSRNVHDSKSGHESTKYRLRIEDNPSPEKTSEAERALKRLLQDLVDQPALLMCGPTLVQKFRVFHNGTAWMLEGEAEVFSTPQS